MSVENIPIYRMSKTCSSVPSCRKRVRLSRQGVILWVLSACMAVTGWFCCSRGQMPDAGSGYDICVFYPCCPWCLSADILRQASLCHLNVGIIVRDSKASDGNDYRVENNRFPLVAADCWLLATLSQPVEGVGDFAGLYPMGWKGEMAGKHQWNGNLYSDLLEKWNLEPFHTDKWSSSVIPSCSVIGRGTSWLRTSMFVIGHPGYRCR